jgi:hypothetical protein
MIPAAEERTGGGRRTGFPDSLAAAGHARLGGEGRRGGIHAVI